MTIAGVVAESFPKAETYLLQLADLNVSAQRIRRMTRLRGRERIRLRQQVTQYYQNSKLPDQLHRVPDGVVAPQIAAISFDGGRYQVLDRSVNAMAERVSARAGGTHRKGSHWKESRVACVMSMTGNTHESDPMPQLPDFLAGGSQLQRKLTEIGHVMSLADSATGSPEQESMPPVAPEPAGKSLRRSREKPIAAEDRPLPGPDLVKRDVIASAEVWRDFGESVVAEAWSQGFAGASRKVCICDGNDAIRRVCETHFSDYVHILDLMHALSYSMNAARAVGGSADEINRRYRQWAELIWSGQVGTVIEELSRHRESIGDPPAKASADDPREAIRAARVYYTNQRSRMDYPRYRRLGLPLTSSLMESAVKQIGRRVKSSEKFWSVKGGDELLAL
ncbi:MAG: hypothetical protein ACF787_13660, partial [Rhodopirellula sp. JB053]